MTIGIAALCENKSAVVLASDKMVTARHLDAEFEHPGTKLLPLTQTCMGLSAGDALASTDLFKAVEGHVSQLQAPSIDLIADAVQSSFSDQRRKQAEDRFLKPRGLTLEAFYQEGLIRRLPSEVAVQLDRQIQSQQYRLSVIIAGIDTKGGHVYGVEDPGEVSCYDRLGYHAVGSGQRHALLHIISREHSVSASLNETVYLVYAAKRNAEMAYGVGEESELAIVTPSGLQQLGADDYERLEEVYEEEVAPQQEAISEEVDSLPFQLGEANDK